MSVERRLDKLEQGAGIDEQAEPVCLFWPETSRAERAAIKAEARRRMASGQYEPGKLYWRDGSEASPP